MSLINKALKQEQRRRAMGAASGPMPPAFGSAAARAAHRQDNKNTIILVGLLAVGLLLVASLLTFVYFGSRYLDQVADAGKPAPAEAPATAETAAAAAKEQSAASEAPSTSPAPVAAKHDATPAAPQPQPSDAPSETADGLPQSSGPPEIDIDTQLFLESLQILGVRSAGAESRLLIAGRVYKLGDTIDHRYGVRFTGADGEKIYFEDERGAVYTRAH